MRVVNEYIDDVEKWKKFVPYIEVLSNPGLKERHWIEINKKINTDFNYKEGNFQEILNTDFENYFAQFFFFKKKKNY